MVLRVSCISKASSKYCSKDAKRIGQGQSCIGLCWGEHWKAWDHTPSSQEVKFEVTASCIWKRIWLPYEKSGLTSAPRFWYAQRCAHLVGHEEELDSYYVNALSHCDKLKLEKTNCIWNYHKAQSPPGKQCFVIGQTLHNAVGSRMRTMVTSNVWGRHCKQRQPHSRSNSTFCWIAGNTKTLSADMRFLTT